MAANNLSACHLCTRRLKPVAGRLGCPVDGVDITEHAAAGDCPKGLHASGAPRPKAAVPQVPEMMKTVGPPLWAEFHRWTLAGMPDREEWLAVFRLKLPCGECRRDFDNLYLEAMPPPADPAQGFWGGWGVHNRINRKLSKTEMSLEDARLLWRQT